MDAVRFGRSVRALRQQRGWRQDDLAAAARVSRGVVSRIERGQADRASVARLERVAAALGARVTVRLDWNGQELDRLLDRRHAALVDALVGHLRDLGWAFATEVAFNHYGERGAIDVLAWHAASGSLLVIEVKTVVPDIRGMLATLDRKARLAPGIGRAGLERDLGVAAARGRRARDGTPARRRAGDDVRARVPAPERGDPALAAGAGRPGRLGPLVSLSCSRDERCPTSAGPCRRSHARRATSSFSSAPQAGRVRRTGSDTDRRASE